MAEMEKLIAEVLSFCPWGEVGPRTAGEVAKALTEAGYRKPQKTADEMFAELGYSKTGETALHTCYEDKEGHRIFLKFPGGRYPGNLLVLSKKPGIMDCELNEKEILACAQKIREMEESEE